MVHKRRMKVRAARLVLSLAMLVALVIPFAPLAQGALFAAFTVLAFVAFPRRRRADVAVALILFGGLCELSHMAIGLEPPAPLWPADLTGVALACLPILARRGELTLRRVAGPRFALLARYMRPRQVLPALPAPEALRLEHLPASPAGAA